MHLHLVAMFPVSYLVKYNRGKKMNKKICLLDYGFVSQTGYGKEFLQKVLEKKEVLQDKHIQDPDPEKSLGKKGLKYVNNGTKMLGSAYYQTLKNPNLNDYVNNNLKRVSVYNGSELLNLHDSFEFELCAVNKGPNYVSPMIAPSTLANVASSFFSIKSKITGPNVSVSAGKCGGVTALCSALIHFEENFFDIALVGSVEVEGRFHNDIKIAESRQDDKFHEHSIAMILSSYELAKENEFPILANVRDFVSWMQEEFQNSMDVVEKAFNDLVNNEKSIVQKLTSISLIGFKDYDSNIMDSIYKKFPHVQNIEHIEDLIGDGDNTGGLIGVANSIEKIEDREFALIISRDPSGYCQATLIQKGVPSDIE